MIVAVLEGWKLEVAVLFAVPVAQAIGDVVDVVAEFGEFGGESCASAGDDHDGDLAGEVAGPVGGALLFEPVEFGEIAEDVFDEGLGVVGDCAGKGFDEGPFLV